MPACARGSTRLPVFSEPAVYPHPSKANPVRFRIQWTDPRLGRQQEYRKTRPEADARRAEIIAEQLTGTTVRGHDRLGPWLDRWMEAVGGIRPSSRERYARAVKTWRSDPICRMELRDLRADDVELAIRRMEQRGQTAGTIGTALTVLRQALDGAVRADRIVRNVARAARAPKVERKAIDPPRGADRARLDAAIADDAREALWVAGLVGGLRISEALGLQWRDVDLDAGLLTVRKQLDRDTHERTRPKSEHSKRTIPVYPALTDALRRARDRAYPPGVSPHPTAYVFTDADGSPLVQRSVTRWFHELCARAGVRRYRFHDLRHAAITDLALRGMKMPALQRWAGHSSVQITERYMHVESTDIVLPPATGESHPGQGAVTQSVTH